MRVLPPGAEPVGVDATMVQQPLVPRRVFWLLSGLLTLLIVLSILVTALLRQRPVSIAGPAPLTVPVSSPASTSASMSPTTATTSSPPATTTTAPRRPSGRSATGGSGDSTRGAAGPGGTVGTSFVVRADAAPGIAGRPQLFSYVVPAQRRLRVLSVALSGPAGDTGRVEVRHGDTVLGVFDLATLPAGVRHTFADPPLAGPGERITLAVYCGNADRACRPAGRFAAALVR
ncbi:hypothetical protein [Actinophytocola sp.]|uniref:hypothetical protein n=1 Tax=Actinophytocola sp. TaxID=1872138 RepID=UPI00389A0E21